MVSLETPIDELSIESDEDVRKLNKLMKENEYIDQNFIDNLVKSYNRIAQLGQRLNDLETAATTSSLDFNKKFDLAVKQIKESYIGILELHKLEKGTYEKRDENIEYLEKNIAVKRLNSYIIDDVFRRELEELHKIDKVLHKKGKETPVKKARKELRREAENDVDSLVAKIVSSRLDNEDYLKVIELE